MERKLRVLVVDDEELIRELIVEAVEPFIDGGEIIEVSDGQEALEAFREQRIDILITDIRMPRVSGEELVECLEEYSFKVPMLVVTGHGDREMAIRLMRLGAFDFLEKPFDSELLEERISRAVESRRKILLELNLAEEKLVEKGLIGSIDEYYQLGYEERRALIKKMS
ncbi:hypothetical protein COB52_05275 [Candidatus Kaiserbacteria bacterium]|nr:MAG: hypothetical protein COB52_05275 [Candidatus Kaiserbacteria bacterium]